MVGNICKLALVNDANLTDDLIPRISVLLRGYVFRPDRENIDALLLCKPSHTSDPRCIHLVKPGSCPRNISTPKIVPIGRFHIDDRFQEYFQAKSMRLADHRAQYRHRSYGLGPRRRRTVLRQVRTQLHVPRTVPPHLPQHSRRTSAPVHAMLEPSPKRYACHPQVAKSLIQLVKHSRPVDHAPVFFDAEASQYTQKKMPDPIEFQSNSLQFT